MMRKQHFQLVVLLGLGAFLAGCAGPEEKLGRGLRNATEFARLGEFRRSIEQTGVWDGTQKAYTTGAIRGFNRSVARTAIGVWEVATFMIPTKADGTYGPILTPKAPLYPDPSIRTYTRPFGGLALTEDPVFPDSYAPTLPSNTIWDTDTNLGFSGGDVVPMVPGSRFSVFSGDF